MRGLYPWRDSVEMHLRAGYLPEKLELYVQTTRCQCLEWFAKIRGGGSLELAKRHIERFDLVLE